MGGWPVHTVSTARDHTGVAGSLTFKGFDMSNTQSLSPSMANVADRVARSTDAALHATQSAANRAFDSLSGKVESLRERANPLVNKASARAEMATHYVQEQPLKSLLIAAAAGAALVTMLGWMGRSRSRY
jgi:ElaB/YqjD/DUF883 family membrane-anchored ribosome-binding protein